MRVLAINQFYYPDLAATSQLLTQLCVDLVGVGHEVTVLASQGSYSGSGRLQKEEAADGVRIRRPWATRLGRDSVARRLADYATFSVSALATGLAERKPDVVLTLTSPPMIGAAGAALKLLKGVPLVTWVQDVYPDVAVAFGILPRRHPATRVLGAVNRTVHRSAHTVVALSHGMAKLLKAQGAKRVEVIQNWSDGQVIRPLTHAENPMRKEIASDDEFVVMYSGNLGVGHDVATILGAAQRLNHIPTARNVRFVFVGGGARRQEAIQRSRGLPNVAFLPYQPWSQLSESLSAADLHVASLREGLEGLLVPSKLYGVLAAGRPLAYIGPENCEVTRTLSVHGVGFSVRPGDVDGLAHAIAMRANDPDWCTETGERARRVFTAHFDRPVAVRRWINVLRRASGECP